MKKNVFKVDFVNDEFTTLKEAKFYLKSLTPSELRNLYNRCEGRITILHDIDSDIVATTQVRPNDDYTRVFFGRPTAF